MKKGFTLIELMIVMIIMGILATIGVTVFISSQVKGRDTSRKGALKAIAQALELYYNDKGKYPTNDSAGSGTFTSCYTVQMDGPNKCGVLVNGTRYDVFKDTDNTSTIYMTHYPNDPTANLNYWYASYNGSQYQLYAHLENREDMQRITPSPAPNTGNPDCGDYACNYGISSANTNP